MKLVFAILSFTFMVAIAPCAEATDAPSPPAIAFVIHPRGITLTKHPAKPILYVTCTAAQESRNLVSLQLDASGNVLTNSFKSFNFFDSCPTNQPYQHAIVRPALLAEEGILYLAVQPDYPAYLANTNHQEIAAVAIDADGQPTKVLHAFRTSHAEQGIRSLQWEPTTRRLYVSYNIHFGWLNVGRDGLAQANKFNDVVDIGECWNWVFVPTWQRFYARQTRTNSGLTLFKLAANGLTTELIQNACTHTQGDRHLAVSTVLHRVYYLDRGKPCRLVSFQLSEDGRLTGLPRYHDLYDDIGMQFDFAGQRLYTWSPDAVLRTWSLDAQGLPAADPKVSALNCGAIRDVIVDSDSGKVYVLITQPISAT